MNQIVNISKVTPPLLPKIIQRPRLINLLTNHQDRKLIFIKGQGAHGKTTLAASYVISLETRSAWVMLEPED
jgi:ATP/maltotriose-dependent transcriptional regulator MalT